MYPITQFLIIGLLHASNLKQSIMEVQLPHITTGNYVNLPNLIVLLHFDIFHTLTLDITPPPSLKEVVD